MIRRIISMTFTSAKPGVKAERVHAGPGKEVVQHCPLRYRKYIKTYYHIYFYGKEISFTNI